MYRMMYIYIYIYTHTHCQVHTLLIQMCFQVFKSQNVYYTFVRATLHYNHIRLSGRTGVEVDTSCYFCSPDVLNFKPSLIIFQRATLSNRCTSLRKLMAALHIVLFPYFHSKCITTNLILVTNDQE